MFHFKTFFPIYSCKHCFPSCGPSWPLGTLICKSLNLRYVRYLSCTSELFWLIGSWEEKFSMISHHICIFVIFSPLKKTWPFICIILNSLHPRMICTKFDWNWPTGSEGEDFFFNINTCNIFPICGYSWPPCTMIWTNLILHYIRKLSCKYELFSLSNTWEDFSMAQPHFCDYLPFDWLIIYCFTSRSWIFQLYGDVSPLKRTWLFIWNDKNNKFWIPFTQGWFVPCLIEIGLLVLEKIFFSM
jgi:hypothetical protein